MATSASVYNYQRTVRQILKRHRKDPTSFVVHIHPQFMRFEKQDGCFMFESRTKVRGLPHDCRTFCTTFATNSYPWTSWMCLSKQVCLFLRVVCW